MNFDPFPKIESVGKLFLTITQKIHGTNAHVIITKSESGETEIRCASRTRFITPEDDNFGFAAFVHANRDEFIAKLGPGRHDGEWAGPGINSGEGLNARTFVLFDFWKYPPDRELPTGCRVVPVLYKGALDVKKVDEAMDDLKSNGSKLVPGFMRPEGVVITLGGTRYKKVFAAEETGWKKGDGTGKTKVAGPDYSHLCQPIRLEKMLSKDEQYIKGYPKNLPQIVRAYTADLVEEGQISGTDAEVKAVIKKAGSQLFEFVRTIINERIT